VKTTRSSRTQTVGPVAVDCDIFADVDAELKIVILSAAPDSEDETKLRLAFLAGVPAQASDDRTR